MLIDKYKHLYLWLHLYRLVDVVVATNSYIRKHSKVTFIAGIEAKMLQLLVEI